MWRLIFPRTGGQFVEISLPRVGEAPISVSDYGDGWIDLLIRNVGKVTGALFTLKEGDNVWLRGCYGNGYPVDTLRHKPLLVVAGGTGVAPVKGLMRYFVENPQEIGQLDMILGYKNHDGVLYKEEMAAWHGKHNLVLTLDEGEADDRFQIGRVTDRLAEMALSDIDTMQAIVVGPTDNDRLYRKNVAAKRAETRSTSGWTTNAGWPAPSGSAATAVMGEVYVLYRRPCI
ncbi:anaerobic sulfite reductase subunit B [Salmonella bongori]|nr:anaerobic sulfite reductase subunit B [Salmonella bongori]